MRLFFALWPSRDSADALHAWALGAQREAGGRVTRAETIHLTLAFLGDVAPERLASTLAAARAVRFEAHAMTMQRTGYWPQNRIVWAGPGDEAALTSSMAEALRARLAEQGFVLEKRRFAAHVTLLRKAGAKGALPPLAPVLWPVEEFVLVRSQRSAQGSGYEVLERFGAS